MRVTFAGHSTLLLEIDGVRVLTDPVLRDRILHIRRRVPPVDLAQLGEIDIVLISHVHHDHFDPASLRKLPARKTIVVPRGAEHMARRLGFEQVIELGAGQRFEMAGIELTATFAEHRAGRLLQRGPPAIGFLISGTQQAYFAGDTDVFEGMSALGDLDLALLPVWGWGPRAERGHMNPARAAQALELLRPRVAIPIHWGTLFPIGRSFVERFATQPPQQFAREAGRIAPETDVRILAPGDATTIE